MVNVFDFTQICNLRFSYPTEQRYQASRLLSLEVKFVLSLSLELKKSFQQGKVTTKKKHLSGNLINLSYDIKL